MFTLNAHNCDFGPSIYRFSLLAVFFIKQTNKTSEIHPLLLEIIIYTHTWIKLKDLFTELWINHSNHIIVYYTPVIMVTIIYFFNTMGGGRIYELGIII